MVLGWDGFGWEGWYGLKRLFDEGRVGSEGVWSIELCWVRIVGGVLFSLEF